MSLLSMFRRSKKVMIVEDDVVLRSTLRDKCKERGFDVLEASEASEVLALLGTEKPDALILDLILPAKDGISLLEELRNSGYTLPVIILSNLLGSDDLRADAERLDASFYNKSSVTLDELVEELEKRIT